jgi:hypothetical protein
MGGLYAEESFLQVLLITGMIGGGAAWLSGGAIAGTWRPLGHVFGYMLLLGGAVRFVHFALFEGTLLSLSSYVCDTAFLMLAAALSWRITRTNQMVRQYNWLYKRTGPLTWAERAQSDANGGGNTTSA